MTDSITIGCIIKYLDPTRMGMSHYGEVVEIRITKRGIQFVTQDHHIVDEKNVKAELAYIQK